MQIAYTGPPQRSDLFRLHSKPHKLHDDQTVHNSLRQSSLRYELYIYHNLRGDGLCMVLGTTTAFGPLELRQWIKHTVSRFPWQSRVYTLGICAGRTSRADSAHFLGMTKTIARYHIIYM